jgi:hypothetical protein
LFGSASSAAVTPFFLPPSPTATTPPAATPAHILPSRRPPPSLKTPPCFVDKIFSALIAADSDGVPDYRQIGGEEGEERREAR